MRVAVFMKSLLSYILPITQKIQSEYNGVVELTWINGKKLLDSRNSNYSYGSLQRILKFGLTQINTQKITNVLLLGLGGGSVIKTLRNDFNFSHKITAVEIDKVVIDLAQQEFNIKPNKNLEISHMDAAQYVQQSQGKFDLIIVDLFIDNNVPDIFYSNLFWKNIIRLIPENGYVIFNASVSKPENDSLANVIGFIKNSFLLKEHNLVEGTNTVIIGQKVSN